jgi:aminoglycoside phosphotransferase (APT) family kinase protein
MRRSLRRMHAVDLAVYADTLAAKSSALAAQLERARDVLRQTAIEREARRSLDEATIERLERLGVLRSAETRGQRADVASLASDLAALEELKGWVEARLFAAREESCLLD